MPWEPEESGEIASGDPRAAHAARYAELAAAAPSLLLPLPRFALASAAAAAAGDAAAPEPEREWDAVSVASWSASPTLADAAAANEAASAAPPSGACQLLSRSCPPPAHGAGIAPWCT